MWSWLTKKLHLSSFRLWLFKDYERCMQETIKNNFTGRTHVRCWKSYHWRLQQAVSSSWAIFHWKEKKKRTWARPERLVKLLSHANGDLDAICRWLVKSRNEAAAKHYARKRHGNQFEKSHSCANWHWVGNYFKLTHIASAFHLESQLCILSSGTS